MKDKIASLKALYDEGNKFNYNSSSSKTENGFIKTLNEEYTSWQLRIGMTLEKIFGRNNPIYKKYDEHNKYPLLGYGDRMFNPYHMCSISALKTGIDTLEKDYTLILKEEQGSNILSNTEDIFIVHGHDEQMKQEVEILISELGLNPIVLHRKADEGQTIIEKFEKNSQVAYAIILLTPDDICYSRKQEELDDKERVKEFRARQNVIFEFGYFVGKLGRNRVCCLYKEGTEIPSDVNGLIYKKVVDKVDEIAFSLIKDLKAVGLSVNI